MPDNPATLEFYAELRALLGNATPPAAVASGGPGRNLVESGLGDGADASVLDRKRQVEAAHARALKSLSELAKRNEEAERRAKATVHAMSARYLKALEKNPDVHEGDPLFFFGYGLECMEDIIHAGFCQVNASVNLYLEELDARFHNLLVMAEEIDAAQEQAKRLGDELKNALEAFDARQAAWRDEAQRQATARLAEFVGAQKAEQAQGLEAVLASQRSLRVAVARLTVAASALGGLLLFYFIKTHL